MQTSKFILFLILFISYLPVQIFFHFSIIKLTPELFIIFSLLFLRKKIKILKYKLVFLIIILFYLLIFFVNLYYRSSSLIVAYSISRFYLLPLLFYIILYNENLDVEKIMKSINLLVKIILLLALVEFLLINLLNLAQYIQNTYYIPFEERMRYSNIMGIYKVMFPFFHSQHNSIFYLIVFIYFWFFDNKKIFVWKFLSIFLFIFTITGTSMFTFLIIYIIFLIERDKYHSVKLISFICLFFVLIYNLDYLLYLKSGYTELNYQGKDISILMYYINMFLLHYIESFFNNLHVFYNIDFSLYMFNYNRFLNQNVIDSLLFVKQSEVHFVKLTLMLGIPYLLFILFVFLNTTKKANSKFIKVILITLLISAFHYNTIQVWFFIFITVSIFVYVHKYQERYHEVTN